MNEVKTSKLIFDPKVARRLCKLGNFIIDIKAYRGDINRTVFVFENNEKFQTDLLAVMNEIKTRGDADKQDERFMPSEE